MPLPRGGDLDEFDGGGLASKRLEAEQKRRRELARKKRLAEEAALRLAKETEASLKAAAESRRAEIARQSEADARLEAIERQRTGGIQWTSELKAVATAGQGDRIELPESALVSLEQLGALEHGGPLFFELSIANETVDTFEVDEEDDNSFFQIRKGATYASVREFKANQGEVGLPPKSMLSLARGDPEIASRLERGEILIRVQYVILPAPKESRAALTPLADGFFIDENADEIQLDLKGVLEDELRLHAALTKGDWLAVDLDSHTVRLRVDQLSPHAAMSILHTDLEIELLASERVQAQAKEAKVLEARRAVRQAQRLEAKQYAYQELQILLEEAKKSAEKQQKIRFQLRFPNGTKTEATFLHEAPASALSILVVANAPDDLKADWSLVSTYPRRTLSRQELTAGTLNDLGLGATSIALLVQDREEEEAEDSIVHSAGKDSSQDVWRSAKTFAEAEERRKATKKEATPLLPDSTEDKPHLTGAGKALAFGRLVAAGVTDRVKAAHSAQSYAQQILELDTMGLLDKDPNLVLRLLDRYGGRLLRVINALSDAIEQKQTSMDIDTPPASRHATPPSPPVDAQALVALHFQRLVANGTPPNTAAAQALVLAADPRLQSYSRQRQDLKAMGFDDIAPSTLDLLDRHNGKIDDVAVALLEQQEGGRRPSVVQ